MALKAVIDSIDGLDDGVKPLYREIEDDGDMKGKFVLDVEPHAGFALENVEGLKSALGKERTTRETLERQVVKFKDIDPDKARDALAQLDELGSLDPAKEADKIANTKFEAAKSQLLERHGAEIKAKEDRIGQLTGEVERLLVEQVATTAIAEAKGSVELLLPHITKHTRVKEVDGKFITEVVDKDGNTRIADSAGTPMDIAGLVADMRRPGSPFERAFDAPDTSGSGKRPGNGSPGGSGQLKRSQMTVKQKSDYQTEHGQAAFLKLPK
jgi:regulator of replication initiation timing